MIIAFGHRSGTGKDTAGKMLVQSLRLSGKHKLVVRNSFAKLLKDVCYQMYKCQGMMPGEWYEEPGNWHKKDEMLAFGKTVRQVWIEVGMAMRAIYEHTWRDAALRVEHDVLVVTDLRFNNEASEVKRLGGICVRVENPRVTKWHDSDYELKDFSFDEVITNDGDLNTLNDRVLELATKRSLL